MLLLKISGEEKNGRKDRLKRQIIMDDVILYGVEGRPQRARVSSWNGRIVPRKGNEGKKKTKLWLRVISIKWEGGLPVKGRGVGTPTMKVGEQGEM